MVEKISLPVEGKKFLITVLNIIVIILIIIMLIVIFGSIVIDIITGGFAIPETLIFSFIVFLIFLLNYIPTIMIKKLVFVWGTQKSIIDFLTVLLIPRIFIPNVWSIFKEKHLSKIREYLDIKK